MPFVSLTNRQTGASELVDADQVPTAVASGKYLDPGAVAVHRDGQDTYAQTAVAGREATFAPVIDPAKAAIAEGHAIRERANTGVAATAKAFAGGGARGLSFGLVNPFEDAQEFNGVAAGAGNIAGALAPALVGDAGGLLGLGRGAAVADDALSAERAASSLSSHALFGDAARGAGEADQALARASAAVREGAQTVHPDLAALDAKGLRAAHAAELDAIEAGRVPQRAQLADDLAAFRAQAKEDKLFLATKGIKEDGINVLGKRTLKADAALDRLLDNPKALAAKPQRSLDALQQQESALEGILAKEEGLRSVYATDETGARAATLDKIAPALERNRQLQARIGELGAEPASARLSAIRDAQAVLATPAPAVPAASVAEQALSGTAFGAITGAASSIPLLGQIPGVAHWIGAKGAKLATDLVFGRLRGAIAGAAEASGKAVESFLGAAKAAAPTGAVLATRVLADHSYGPSPEPAGGDLHSLYKARSSEVRALTAYGPTGEPQMRAPARQALADRLAGVRAISPMLADRMETAAARRVEWLASQLPRKPDAIMPGMGPDSWRPSDLEMRAWARKAAAAADPAAAMRRLATGRFTPEDRAAMEAVHPEQWRDFLGQISAALPTLQRTLPYARRLALALATGAPVDPAMHPRVLAMLQGQFAAEPGSNGGVSAPRPAPQFGSLKKSLDNPTPAQSRATGARR
jgi:hypothetical protein